MKTSKRIAMVMMSFLLFAKGALVGFFRGGIDTVVNYWIENGEC